MQEIAKRLDPENIGQIDLGVLIAELSEFLALIGNKKELLEAFGTLDEKKKGKLELFDFRFYLKKYAQISDEDLDQMVLDIFEVKKLSQVDKGAEVDYKAFADKIFATN